MFCKTSLKWNKDTTLLVLLLPIRRRRPSLSLLLFIYFTLVGRGTATDTLSTTKHLLLLIIIKLKWQNYTMAQTVEKLKTIISLFCWNSLWLQAAVLYIIKHKPPFTFSHIRFFSIEHAWRWVDTIKVCLTHPTSLHTWIFQWLH